MADRWMGVLELALVFGLIIALAVWELVKLRQDNQAARERDALDRKRLADTERTTPDSPSREP